MNEMSGQKLVKMYNLNVNVNVATSLPVGFLGLDGQSNTPRTPEIVNSLMAMTNPFDALMKPSRETGNSPGSEESCSGTVSPLGSPTSSPPSVQHTRSQLIKEGLKLTIQTKRKQSGSETKEDVEEFESKRTKREELTEEDEERRKRRRERNKIAATKCRMKKREKTANLVNESEQLETQNFDLKSQIQDLQKQLRGLQEMLSMHTATCVRHVRSQTFEDFVGTNGYDGQTAFGSAADSATDFEIGSTNGAPPMNPFGKDPNFAAKMLEDPYSRAFGGNAFDEATNIYQTKPSRGKSDGNRSCFEYEQQSDKKSEKCGPLTVTPVRRERPKRGPVFDDEDEDLGDVFRGSFQLERDVDDGDSYKPNGIIDGNFLAGRADNLFGGTGNDYVSGFGNTPLDNGCMA